MIQPPRHCLTETEQSALINAVPSFAAPWRAHLEMRAAYVKRYPDAALTPEQHTHDFLGDLAGHLGIAVAAGELHEAEWLFAALEPVYQRADHDLEAQLTVGFMESLIYAIEGAGADAMVLHVIAKAPLTERAWRQAYSYTQQ